MTSPRLADQLAFLVEIDKVKQVLRQTVLADGSRRENDAEHMWHFAVAALVLAEYAREPIDLRRVLTMILVHDLVEIDAGDTFVYDEQARRDQEEREREAADRIFGLLPGDQAERFRGLWEEFEARQSPDARFAAALDRLQPILLNVESHGAAWRRHGVTSAQVLERNRTIADGSPDLWEYVQGLIQEAVAKGYLAP